MKKIITLVSFSLFALLFSACSTIISDESYAKATRGETVLEYGGFSCSKEALKNAVMLSLQERGWTIVDSNNPIKAQLVEFPRQNAKISIDVQKGKLVIDTKGSLVDGNKAYVPLRYLDYLLVSVRKHVMQASK